MRKDVLQTKFIFSATGIVLLAFCFFIESKSVFAQDLLSPQIRQVVPQIEEKLQSTDLSDKLSILNQLVIRKRDYDIVKTELRFTDLPVTDYAIVIKSLFDKEVAKSEFDDEAWWKIIFLIRQFGLKQFSGVLADYLPKSKPPIQSFIIITLRRLKADETAPKIAALPVWTAEYVRHEALSALIAFSAKEAIPWLIPLLSNKNAYVRSQAAQNLAKVGGREAASLIARLLTDADPNTRHWALDALVKLDARETAAHIWQLVNTGQTEQTEAYALAALVKFGQKRAFALAVERISENSNRGGETFRHLVEADAKPIVPWFIAILEGKYGTDAPDYKSPWRILTAFGVLRATEAIPILRSFVRLERGGNEEILREIAVRSLGLIGAREAVDDLLPLLNKPVIERTTSVAHEAAMALARIGERRTWENVIDFAANPKCFDRSEIVSELNRHLDAQLWRQIHQQEVQGSYIQSVKITAESLTAQSGVPIVLHYQPAKPISGNESPADDGYARANTSVQKILLIYGINSIIEGLSQYRRPFAFTYVFDDKQVHIMSVENAIEWWRKNILKKS